MWVHGGHDKPTHHLPLLPDPPFPILNIKHKPTHDCVKLPISAFVMCLFVCMSCVHCRMRLRCVNVAWEEGEALDTNATPPRVLITMYLPLTTLLLLFRFWQILISSPQFKNCITVILYIKVINTSNNIMYFIACSFIVPLIAKIKIGVCGAN